MIKGGRFSLGQLRDLQLATPPLQVRRDLATLTGVPWDPKVACKISATRNRWCCRFGPAQIVKGNAPPAAESLERKAHMLGQMMLGFGIAFKRRF
jgi:hypothetical protein